MRIVLGEPDLAIFDEATADAALAGRTGLIIAHRLSQAAECDRIVVMDKGHIIEDGTHDDLFAADGTYARLWRAWSGAQGCESTLDQ